MNATTSDRIPQRQFRGTWAHVDLFDFIESGELSPRAAWLAMIIDSFCKGKKGCFAGNDHLATRLNVKERQIQNLLAELEKVGILKIKFVGKIRYLRIDWSQDSEDTRKTAYRTAGRYAKNCVSDTQKIASIGEVANATSKKLKKSTSPATRDDREETASPTSGNENNQKPAKNDYVAGLGLGKELTPDQQFDRRIATKLYQHLLNKKTLERYYRVPPGPKWAIEIAQLRQIGHSQQIIEFVLDGYIRWCDDDHMPWAHCAKSFREKFAKIRKMIAKLKGEAGESTSAGRWIEEELGVNSKGERRYRCRYVHD